MRIAWSDNEESGSESDSSRRPAPNSRSSKLARQAGRIALAESDGSDESDRDYYVPGQARYDDSGSDQDYDSEEELYPVHHVQPPARRPPHLKVYDGGDEHDDWLAAESRARLKSTEIAKASFTSSMAQLQAQQRAVERDSRVARHARAQQDLDEVSALLEGMTLQRQQEDAKILSEFEARSKAIWDAVNQTIAETEALNLQREAEQRAADEAERVRAQAEEQERTERAEAAARRQREADAKSETERKAKADAQRAEKVEKEAVEAAAAAKPEPGSAEADWVKWMGVIQTIKSEILPAVSANREWSQACRQAKRTMTTKVGQVTNEADQIRLVTTTLYDVLANLHATSPECYRWGLNHLSKVLIKQAETELLSRNAAGFPLGRVVIGLLLHGHKELGEVLFGRLVKKCFWLTAWFPRRTPGMEEEAHRKLLGYAPATSAETTTQYADRMSGIVALWSAIVQTSPMEPPQAETADKSALANVPHVFRPAAGWTWLTRMFKPPLAGLEPTPRLLDTFITLAGPAMLDAYPTQFPKLIVALLDHGIGKDEAGFAAKAKPAIVRLTITMEGWRDHGKSYEPVPGRSLDAA